jgi:hypothetical protein
VVNQGQCDAAVAAIREQADGLHVLMNTSGPTRSICSPRSTSTSRTRSSRST